MDYSTAFGAEFREVQDLQREGQAVRAVVAGRSYATHREDLWQAVTDPERIPRWFAPVTGQFELGGRFQIEGNAAGEILRCDAPELLEVTWEFGGQISWVLVRLTPEGEDRTRLTLEHLMPKDEASEEHWAQYGPGATGVGWELGLLGLGMHIDSGGLTVDRDEAFGWMASDPGTSFMRRSAER